MAEIEPTTREAMYRACSEVIATNPELAAAAHLHRGLVSLAGGDADAAVADFQAAVASQDGEVVYKAATHLLRMGRGLAPWISLRGVYQLAGARAVMGLHGGVKSAYTREIRDWVRASGTMIFDAHPHVILAWLHGRPGHTVALPALDRFYGAAAELGYAADPMSQVWQLLGLSGGPSVPPQTRTSQATL